MKETNQPTKNLRKDAEEVMKNFLLGIDMPTVDGIRSRGIYSFAQLSQPKLMEALFSGVGTKTVHAYTALGWANSDRIYHLNMIWVLNFTDVSIKKMKQVLNAVGLKGLQSEIMDYYMTQKPEAGVIDLLRQIPGIPDLEGFLRAGLGIQSVKESVKEGEERNYGLYYHHSTLEDFTLIFSIPEAQRDLPALALHQRRLQQGEDWYKENCCIVTCGKNPEYDDDEAKAQRHCSNPTPYYHSRSSECLSFLKEKCIPTTLEMLAVAKEYQIPFEKVKLAADELEKARGGYEKVIAQIDEINSHPFRERPRDEDARKICTFHLPSVEEVDAVNEKN